MAVPAVNIGLAHEAVVLRQQYKNKYTRQNVIKTAVDVTIGVIALVVAHIFANPMTLIPSLIIGGGIYYAMVSLSHRLTARCVDKKNKEAAEALATPGFYEAVHDKRRLETALGTLAAYQAFVHNAL